MSAIIFHCLLPPPFLYCQSLLLSHHHHHHHQSSSSSSLPPAPCVVLVGPPPPVQGTAASPILSCYLPCSGTTHENLQGALPEHCLLAPTPPACVSCCSKWKYRVFSLRLASGVLLKPQSTSLSPGPGPVTRAWGLLTCPSLLCQVAAHVGSPVPGALGEETRLLGKSAFTSGWPHLQKGRITGPAGPP